jgi:hypothetical protein
MQLCALRIARCFCFIARRKMRSSVRQMRRVCTPPQVLRPASETCGLPISAVGVTLAVDDEHMPLVGAGGEPREN